MPFQQEKEVFGFSLTLKRADLLFYGWEIKARGAILTHLMGRRQAGENVTAKLLLGLQHQGLGVLGLSEVHEPDQEHTLQMD